MEERTVWFYTHSMPGNTGIQLSVAHLLAEKFGCNTVRVHDASKIGARSVNMVYETSWEALHPFLSYELSDTHKRFLEGDIGLLGYFQHSEPLVQCRRRILERLATDTTPISKHGTTMREFIETAPPIVPAPNDIVMHVRLGDFAGAGLVIDPVPQLAILRRTRHSRLIIVCAKPTSDAEKNYLKLFEAFHPIYQHGTELEDFAVLRSAKRILVTNSTFSWFAAYLGDAAERWIPEPTYNDLGQISASDHMYKAGNAYPIEKLAIPDEPFLPVTGEFLQSMCDYSILDSAKKMEFHKWIDVACPPERQMFIEEEWPAEVFQARSLFIYPTDDSRCSKHVFRRTWPNLRLILFHNSDYSIDYQSLIPFLDANPDVWCWAQNVTRWHPRIRPVPIGEENRVWRNDGSLDHEPMNTVSRSEQRNLDILVPYWSETCPTREIWSRQIENVFSTRVYVSAKITKNAYLTNITFARAVVCPPGNGFDTHRHWEALAAGAWAIVEDNAHTQALLREYPSLHLIPVLDAEHIHLTEIPEGLPPFHPLLLREFWRVLFQSHII